MIIYPADVLSTYGINFKYINALVCEGLSIGVTPWSRSLAHQEVVYEILNLIGDYPQESMEQTILRRAICG